MLGKRFVAGLLAFSFFSLQTAHAQGDFRTLRWADLSSVVENQKVKVVLRDRTSVEGKVENVLSDALSMVVLKSSDKRAYPRGQASIPRKEITELRIRKIKGPARLIGAAGLGAAGSLISLRVALDDSRPSNDTNRMLGWIVATAACIVGGFFLGRLADTHETLITVLPE